jgi:hypothetical protein
MDAQRSTNKAASIRIHLLKNNAKVIANDRRRGAQSGTLRKSRSHGLIQEVPLSDTARVSVLDRAHPRML